MDTARDADIRLLTAADLDGALTLSTTAGWNQRPEDWRMLLQLAPAGAFAAIADGRIVGTAIGIDYGAFAWIAMMLVDPAYRSQGLGARLLEGAIGAVPSNHPIRLDATPMGRPLYQRFGFEDESILTRHIADADRPDQSPDERPAGRARPLTAADLRQIAEIDAGAFGANRRVLLEWALAEAPHYAHAVDTGATLAYCFGRAGRLFHQIGPVVATRDDEAMALAGAALAAAGARALVVDVYDHQQTFGQWLRSRGFSAQRPLYRMCRRAARGGERPRSGEPLEYAILGPEFA